MHLRKIRIDRKKFPVKDKYPFNIRILNNTKQIVFDKNITFFAGENGTGKSTLLKSLARTCGVHIWEDKNRVKFDLNPYEEMLDGAISLEWADGQVQGSFFGAQIFETFAGLLDEWAHDDPGQFRYFGGKSLRSMSHGQSLMAYFRSRYCRKGIYFMDEPETALSPKTQLELMEILEENGSKGHAQFIIATHSPILLSLPDAGIYGFDGNSIKSIAYKDTGHYNVYSKFFEDMKAKNKRKKRRKK